MMVGHCFGHYNLGPERPEKPVVLLGVRNIRQRGNFLTIEPFDAAQNIGTGLPQAGRNMAAPV